MRIWQPAGGDEKWTKGDGNMTHRKDARPEVLLLILRYRLHNRSSSRNRFHVPRQVRAA